MGGKQAISYFVTILLFFAAFKISPSNGDIISPWSDKKMQGDLMNCVYIGMISDPRLMTIPLQAIDNVKWKMLSDSDSMVGMSYVDKKVAMDDKFGNTMAEVIKQNNFQNNPEIIDVISKLAANCYSSVTGYDSEVVAQEIKAQVKENIEKSSAPVAKNPDSVPFAENQNQQFQPPSQIQPSYVNDAPINPPPIPPANSFNNDQYGNNAPFNPPLQPPSYSYDYPQYGKDAPFKSNVQPPSNSYDYPDYGKDVPFKPNVQPPSNSYDYPQYGNGAPLNPPGSAPVNSFKNPSYEYDYPYYSPALPPVNPPSKPSNVNNAAGPPEKGPSNVDDGQGHDIKDFSQSQASTDDSSDSSLQNDDESFTEYSPDNIVFATTTSSITSYQSSKTPKSDTSSWTTPSPHTDAPHKTTEKETTKDEVPCDEKFKNALYNRLLNDDRFSTFFGKLPGSATKPAVLEIMNRAFNKYGIQQHFPEFKTFWKFNSRTLNKESKVEDWDEVMSKNCKIIFSRNNLMKDDCEKVGIEIADYILEVLPGDPPTSTTEASNPNDGKDDPSSESTTTPSDSPKNASPISDSTTNLSFPELNSKLSEIFNNAGTTVQSNDDVPLSETLSAFEAQQNLETLHNAAESCLSPSGFDLEKFMSTMSDVTDSIQQNHPDWSHDKCEKEMYAVTVAVMADLLQKTAKTSSNDAESESTSDQSDSPEVSSDSQTSDSAEYSSASETSDSDESSDVLTDYNSDSDESSDVLTDYNSDSDDSSYPVPEDDYVPGSSPQQEQDFSNYGDYPDAPRVVNVPPNGNQPGSGGFNSDLRQPSNFAPDPVDTPYLANRPYDSNYGSQDYGPVISQPLPQNLPSQDYPVNAPVYSEKQPFPASKNNGYQQSPSSGFANPSNQYQSQNLGNKNGFNADPPAVNNYNNYQKVNPQSYQNYDYSAPARASDNTQPGYDSNSNSRYSDNRQTYPKW